MWARREDALASPEHAAQPRRTGNRPSQRAAPAEAGQHAARVLAHRGRARAGAFEPTDLAALTADLASAFRSATERAGLQLIVDCPPLPQPVYVDREMWEKIVLNLLSNAFKFTFEGSIRVASRRERRARRAAGARHRDRHPAPTICRRIFERFHRVERAAARTHEGSGIGLALVQRARRAPRRHDRRRRASRTRTRVSPCASRSGTAHLPPGCPSRAPGEAELAHAQRGGRALRRRGAALAARQDDRRDGTARSAARRRRTRSGRRRQRRHARLPAAAARACAFRSRPSATGDAALAARRARAPRPVVSATS